MWKDLSMQQRADLMDIYLSHGISSLDEMRNHYDSRNQFANGGNLFSGENEPTQQMQKRPVTTGGAGYIPSVEVTRNDIRRRLYDHLAPAGYQLPITRTISAVLNPVKKDIIEVAPKSRRKKEIYPNLTPAVRDDIYAEYLQIPKEERHKVIFNIPDLGVSNGQIEETSLRPNNADNAKHFRLKSLTPIEKSRVVKQGLSVPIGKNTNSSPLRIYLGHHTLGHNFDNRGEYVSYYDKWDLAPFTGYGEDQSFGIGKPVHIYDRIYLDNYYGVKQPTHATYLPEVTVYGKKKKK